jgi:hypothetical protein
MNHITGLARDEVIDLCVLINSNERKPSALKWPPILGLFKSVVVTLTYMRHNRTQAEACPDRTRAIPCTVRAVAGQFQH